MDKETFSSTVFSLNHAMLNEKSRKLHSFYYPETITFFKIKEYSESLKKMTLYLANEGKFNLNDDIFSDIAGHSERVGIYSSMMAKALLLSQVNKNNLLYSALFHDIGKVFISEKILYKKDKLTQAEYLIIKEHPKKGCEMLRGLKLSEDIYEAVLHHHERYDGSGYPEGLNKREIPLFSRIIGIADAFDAMTSDRAYRKALLFHTAKSELIKNKGTQFDPFLVDAFLGKLNAYLDEYRI